MPVAPTVRSRLRVAASLSRLRPVCAEYVTGTPRGQDERRRWRGQGGGKDVGHCHVKNILGRDRASFKTHSQHSAPGDEQPTSGLFRAAGARSRPIPTSPQPSYPSVDNLSARGYRERTHGARGAETVQCAGTLSQVFDHSSTGDSPPFTGFPISYYNTTVASLDVD